MLHRRSSAGSNRLQSRDAQRVEMYQPLMDCDT
jgi:hypothetical protein